MDRGFKIFMENSYWRDFYEKAPSDELRECLRYEWNNNPFVCNRPDANYKENMERLERKLGKKDVQYLIDNTPSGQARNSYKEWLERLNKEE